MTAKTGNIIFFLLLSSGFTFTQNTDNKKPLSSILLNHEKSHAIKFSFSDADIKNIFIKEPPEKTTVTELLSFLNKKTFLQFNTLDHRYITVSFLNKTVSICGTILDYTLSKPLLLAAIKVNGYPIGTTTNNRGVFLIIKIRVIMVLKKFGKLKFFRVMKF